MTDSSEYYQELELSHIKGDSFLVTGSLLDSAKQVTDRTGYSVASSIARGSDGEIIQALAAVFTDETTGAFQITATETETRDWPETSETVPPLKFDIQFTDAAGQVVSTSIIRVVVTGDITP